MSIREYIATKFEAFRISEASMADLVIESGLDLDGDYDSDVQRTVGEAMCRMCEELVFAPRQTNISENGFSESWDYANLGKYYLWLCRKWGIAPNKDTIAALGVPTIIDRTSSW